MPAKISQAEKWRQWKKKVQEGTIHRFQDAATSPNVVASARVDNRSSVGETGNLTVSRDNPGVARISKPPTGDNTIKMVHEFIKQCQTRAEKQSNEKPVSDKRLNQSQLKSSLTATQFNQKRPRLEHTDQNDSCSKSDKGNKSCDATHKDPNVGVVDKCRAGDITDSRTRNKSSEPMKYTDTKSRDPPVKNPRIPSQVLGKNKDSKSANTEDRDNANKKADKPRRIVRFVDGDKTAKDKQDKTKKNKSDHDAVVDALQKEGRRLMVHYLAEYITSSESSDDEVVEVSSSNRSENVRFTVHLSSSMKDARPYRGVIFDVIETNEGKAYSATTGRFIAPQKGSYVFFVTTTSTIKEQVEVSIIHNFHPVDPSKIKANKLEDGDMQTKTDAVLLALERHDEIWLLNVTRVSQIHLLQNCHFLTFSGFFLNL